MSNWQHNQGTTFKTRVRMNIYLTNKLHCTERLPSALPLLDRFHLVAKQPGKQSSSLPECGRGFSISLSHSSKMSQWPLIAHCAHTAEAMCTAFCHKSPSDDFSCEAPIKRQFVPQMAFFSLLPKCYPQPAREQLLKKAASALCEKGFCQLPVATIVSELLPLHHGQIKS